MKFLELKEWVMSAVLSIGIATVVYAESDLDLESALRVMYPAVEQWHIVPVEVIDYRLPFATVTVLPSGEVISRSNNFFRVTSFMNDNKILRTYRVEGWRKIAVATRLIPAGGVLDRRVLELKEKDVFRLPCLPLQLDSITSEMRIRQTVRPSEVVCAHNTEAVPLVTRSMPVVLYCNAGSVTVSTDGQSLDEGRLGQRVRVRRENSGRVVSATVTQRGQADACI